jgi:sulfide:quinone oxidoreductase
MKQIVILGGGGGGTIAANTLAHKFSNEITRGEVSVQVIGEGEDHVFEPANLDIAFKGADPSKSLHHEQSLLNRKIRFTPDGASKIDYAERRIVTRGERVIPFDYLVLATGAVGRPEVMNGLKEESLTFHRGPFQAARIWEALQKFKGGKVLVAITSVPYKCPPSPNEAAFMLDEFFRKKGIRDSVEIKFLTPFPRPYSTQSISDVVQPMFEERKIETVPFFTADYVDPKSKKIYSLEGEGHDYDLLIAIPPHRGANVIQASNIGDEEGFLPADKRTMRVKDQSGVYAIGDATNIPISKSGVVAHLQAGTVSMNIESEIKGNSERYEYSGRINCPMETGHRRALFIAGTYTKPPPKQNPTFVRYVMKKGFGRLYWSTLSGGWNWLFDLYFGKTTTPLKPEPLVQEQKLVPVPQQTA